ncbi:MAG TPA: methyltransferase domain-containing protein [Dongiaceae bacterium]|jgi:SAM-dependent methyltransferase|nr:methyltransferase domain-containing protein [Dongiaceae bacterium]
MSAWAEAQYDNVYAPGVEHHWWHLARARIVRRAIDSFPASAILDVGCGPGLMVGYLRERGYVCRGCDLGRPAVIRTAQGAVWTETDALQVDAAFRRDVKLILLLDVLEHLPDPESFLASLRGAYPNLAGIIVSLPARRELWSALDDYFGHHRRYDRPMVSRLLAAGGFRVARQGYVFHSLYPPMLLLRRRRIPAKAITPPRGRSLFHVLVAECFAVEARIPAPWLAGSSLIAVGTPAGKS